MCYNNINLKSELKNLKRKIYQKLLEWKEKNIDVPLMVIRCTTSWKDLYNKGIL